MVPALRTPPIAVLGVFLLHTALDSLLLLDFEGVTRFAKFGALKAHQLEIDFQAKLIDLLGLDGPEWREGYLSAGLGGASCSWWPG